MAKSYVYVNLPDPYQTPEEDLVQIDRAGHAVDLRRLVVEREPVYTPAHERPQMQRLARRLLDGDEVVVVRLACLGASARDILATVDRMRAAGISVRCLEAGPADLARQPEPVVVKTLRAVCRLEALARSARSEASIHSARTNGTPPGRRPTFSGKEKIRIMQRLARGNSVSEVARSFGTSRQTILRIRSAQTR